MRLSLVLASLMSRVLASLMPMSLVLARLLLMCRVVREYQCSRVFADLLAMPTAEGWWGDGGVSSGLCDFLVLPF